jgi:hypothetical protein
MCNRMVWHVYGNTIIQELRRSGIIIETGTIKLQELRRSGIIVDEKLPIK